MRRKMNVKKAVAMGLSIIMLGNSTGTWAEALESSSAAQETADEELNLQSEEVSGEESHEEVTDVSVQTKIISAEPEAVEYHEETSSYPQEVLTTAAAEVLPEEVVMESIAVETEMKSSTQEYELETKRQVQELETFEELETEGYLGDGLVESNFQYRVTDNQAILTAYLGDGQTITLPETLGGYPVTGIGYRAFYGNDAVETIVLPDGIKTIEDSAFAECSNLKSIKLPEKLTTIGRDIIRGTSVESITIPKGLQKCADKQANTSLSGCKTLKEIIFEEGMEKIPAYVAADVTSVNHVVLPESVKEIGEQAFYNTQSLLQITLPESITTMDKKAFALSGLVSIEVPEKVTVLEDGMFYQCRKLEQVKLPDGITIMKRDIFEECSRLRELKLPSKLEWMGTALIRGTQIKSIVVPNTVKECAQEPGRWALSEDSYLKEIIFEEGMERIPSRLILNSESLERVVIPQSVKEIEEKAFSNCGNMVIYGVTGSYAEEYAKENGIPFKDESNVAIEGNFEYAVSGGEVIVTAVITNEEDIVVPETLGGYQVTGIGYRAFYGNCAVKTIVLPDGIKTIEDGAFAECSNLKSIKLPEKLTTIGRDIISGTGIESITIPKGLQKCADKQANTSLSGCKSLKEIIFEEGMEKIPAYVAADVTSVNHVVLPESVKEIGEQAFYNTQSLLQITLPESITTMDKKAFALSGLVSIEVPEKVTVLEDGMFYQCRKLEQVKLPDGITIMKRDIFEECSRLRELKLPSKLEWMGTALIRGTQIKSIVVPNTVKECAQEPGRWALSEDSYLKEIIFEEGMERIPSRLILNSESLERVVIPQSVKEIEEKAFSNCGNMVIYGISGSYAEEYAKEKGIPFKDGNGIYWPFKLTYLGLPTELRMNIGDETTLVYTCEPAISEEQSRTAKWSSSNELVATIKDGIVTAIGEGTTEISVTMGGLTASCKVKVSRKIQTEVIAVAYNKLKISWSAYEEANGYAIYLMNDDGSYSILKYITDKTILSYVNTVTCGVTYTYKVSPYRLDGKKKVFLTESEPMSAKALPAAPSLQSVNMAAYNKIRITWSKVNGCAGYVIYRSEAENGKYSVLKTVTQASATNYVNVVKTSTTYYYKIRAFVTVNGKKVYGDYSSILSGNVITGSPQNFTIKQAANGKITFTWDKVEDADGYVIYLYYPDTNKYKAIKNVTDVDVLTYGKKMTKGATYHFAMRAYRLVNGVKVYSDYGEIVSTK